MALLFSSIIDEVSSKYGAPMGRRDCVSEPLFPVMFCLRQIPLSQGYDQGGAYWGTGGTLWVAWGDGQEEVQELYMRASTRAEAKRRVLSEFPNAQFYR